MMRRPLALPWPARAPGTFERGQCARLARKKCSRLSRCCPNLGYSDQLTECQLFRRALFARRNLACFVSEPTKLRIGIPIIPSHSDDRVAWLFLQLISKRELGKSHAAKLVSTSPIPCGQRLFEMSCTASLAKLVGIGTHKLV